MARTTEYYIEELLKVIKDNNIAFLDHAFAFTSFSSSTAYNHELEKVDSIKAAINNNKVKAKNYMLNKWIESENPTLQVAAMRLLSTPDEHRLLNQSYTEHNVKAEQPIFKTIELDVVEEE